MSRISKRSMTCAVTVMLGAGLGAPVDAGGQADARQGYRFVLKADGGGKTAIRGLITVDGKDRLVEREETPFEFRCEAGSVIAGFFEALAAGRTVRLTVFDPEYSTRRPSLQTSGFDRIRFSWAQPGHGPRCADAGQGACPDATPSLEELKKRMESLR